MRRVRASTLAHAICGVISNFSLSLILRSGFSGLIGSTRRTSSPAAAISPCSKASAKSSSTTIGPLPRFKKIIRQNISGEKIEVRPILKSEDIMEARKVVRKVYLDEKIEQYIADIVFATRYPEKYDLKELKDMIGFGGSPRASINLALAARSYAFIKRRGYVIPEDVRAVAHDVLRHRIGLTYEAEAMNMSSDEIVSKILNKVEVP